VPTIDKVTITDFWSASMQNKKSLLGFVEEKTGVKMDESKLTLGFARRA